MFKHAYGITKQKAVDKCGSWQSLVESLMHFDAVQEGDWASARTLSGEVARTPTVFQLPEFHDRPKSWKLPGSGSTTKKHSASDERHVDTTDTSAFEGNTIPKSCSYRFCVFFRNPHDIDIFAWLHQVRVEHMAKKATEVCIKKNR